MQTKIFVWAFIPYRITEQGLVSEEYDTPGGRQELEDAFAELGIQWKWQPVTLENMQDVVEEVAASSQEFVPIVLNYCCGVEDPKYPGTDVIKLLEEKNIVFTGSDSACDYLCSSKLRMKQAFAKAGVSTAPYEIVDSDESIQGVCDRLGTPLIVKPAISLGCRGLSLQSVVYTASQVQQQTRWLVEETHDLPFDRDNIFVEQFINGREFTVFLVGSSKHPEAIKVYPALEEVFHPSTPETERFLTWDLRLGKAEERTLLPPEESLIKFQLADAKLQDRICNLAKQAYCAVGGNGYGRVDIRMDKGTEELFVLEVNPNCGFSSGSLTVDISDQNATKAGTIFHLAGIPFSEMVSEIIAEAVTRQSAKVADFCTQNHKWLIPSYLASPSSKGEIAAWNEDHKDYSKKIFSVTQDPEICKMLVHPSNYCGFDILDSPEVSIFIPGCGSEIYLQKTILEYCPHTGEVYSTDFCQVAIKKSLRKWQESHPNINHNNEQFVFLEADSTCLTEQHPEWKNKFDYVLVVNSVVSGEDLKNRQMLREFYQILKPGGKLYGFFPTIFSDLEIAYLSKANAHWLTDGSIDLAHSAFYDQRYNDRQILYTPLRLNQIFNEVGFKRLSFEIVFCDSFVLVESSREIFGVDEANVYQWKFLVRLEKPIE